MYEAKAGTGVFAVPALKFQPCFVTKTACEQARFVASFSSTIIRQLRVHKQMRVA